MTGLAATGLVLGSPPASAAAPAQEAGSVDIHYSGAFTDAGEEGVRNLAELQKWLGGSPVRVGHTYLPGDSWDAIEGQEDLLRPWADWRRAEPDRLLVLNVPMQARDEEYLGEGEVRALIRQGANGAEDEHFSRLARHLVELGAPDTVIVLGWEMNGTTYAHRCGPDPEGWKTYWRRIVAAMRAVPGQRFRFDFAPTRGTDAVPWTRCYPGDGSVDVIGMDSYDQPAGESFDQQVAEPYGLQAQVDFAARHGKAVSYPEWGLFRNGDDPGYVEQMLRWMSDHAVLYQTVTDYCPHGVWRCTQNPRSSQVFRTMLSGGGASASPRPTATAARPHASTTPPRSSHTAPAPSTTPPRSSHTAPALSTATPEPSRSPAHGGSASHPATASAARPAGVATVVPAASRPSGGSAP
ncbi:MAG: glycosyl hydrolase family 26, partial [Streptomyces sp.]|nr:glycosyl hydrolase family 26 [Streptomyces sp.]